MLRRFLFGLLGFDCLVLSLLYSFGKIKFPDKVIDDMDFTVFIRLSPPSVFVSGYIKPVYKLAYDGSV